MSPDQLLELTKAVAQAFAKGHTCRTLRDQATNDEDRERLQNQFEQWDARVTQLWAELTAAVNSALPPTLYAVPDPIAAVTAPTNTDIDLRGSLGERAVMIRLSTTQAVAIGTTLIAYAAAVTDRADGHVAGILPPLPATPVEQPARTA